MRELKNELEKRFSNDIESRKHNESQRKKVVITGGGGGIGRYNIRTNCIAPAAIMTEMVKESNLNDPNFDNDFFIKQITPLKRWGKPEDVANLAAFLISDEGAYLNGVIIPCDGGITINGDVNKQIR